MHKDIICVRKIKKLNYNNLLQNKLLDFYRKYLPLLLVAEHRLDLPLQLV